MSDEEGASASQQQHEEENRQEEAGEAAEGGEGGETQTDLFASIFGNASDESSDEDGGFAGFKDHEIGDAPTAAASSASSSAQPKKKKSKRTSSVASEDEDEDAAKKKKSKKEKVPEDENGPFKKKKKATKVKDDGEDVDFDVQCEVILKLMHQAAEEDRELNKAKAPATRKFTALPKVMNVLRKKVLMYAFVESNVYAALANWLMPLPDKSLPNSLIRSQIISVIESLPPLRDDDHERLQESNLGKVCMMLIKHPEETRENKSRLQAIVQKWSRSILQMPDSFSKLNPAEAKEHTEKVAASARRASTSKPAQSQPALRPGDDGFTIRARVPRPESHEFVVRPENKANPKNVDDNTRGGTMLDTLRNSFKKKQSSEGRNGLHSQSVNVSGTYRP